LDALSRAGYLAHATDPAHVRRRDAALAIIAAHPDFAISVSWGKDSAALLWLAAQALPRPTAINARYRHPAERIGDMDCVRDKFLSRPDMRHVRYIEVDCPGEWEMYERAGRAFPSPLTLAERAAVKWWREEFTTRMRAAMTAVGCAGVMLGIRQEESRARRLNIACRGTSYVRADGLRVALPIGRFQGPDIWAVLVAHDLPWLRVYDVALDRGRARSGFVWSTGSIDAIARHGAVYDWRKAYPEEVAQWFARWPELRSVAYV
jgi:3'-phosphoadenosine 5'-phosphosulfate sulfotransferase (PAPS reductase)/FAD synthetase